MDFPTRGCTGQTRVEDTVVDLTQTAMHIEDAISWLARAVGGRFTTAPRLTARLRERPKLRWRSLLCAALGDVEAGCHSLIELTYLRDVERPHGLPASQRQARRETSPHYDDVRYQRYTTRVELDGLAAHPEHDAESYPCHVAAQVASVLRLGGWRGSPRPCARPDCVIPPVPPPARRHGPVIMGDYPSESASNRPRSRKEAGRGGAGRARRG